jgi:hypothetical protein
MVLQEGLGPPRYLYQQGLNLPRLPLRHCSLVGMVGLEPTREQLQRLLTCQLVHIPRPGSPYLQAGAQ